MFKLTHTQCRKVRPRDKDFKLSDGYGLYLLVTSRGSKLWRWKYRFNGVERKLCLGSYPAVSLKHAREIVREQQSLLATNVDPSTEKRRLRLEAEFETATTFKAVANEYIAKMEKEGRATATIIKAQWMLGLLTPSLGHRSISSIRPNDVLHVLKHLEKKGQLETARKVRAFASRVFRYAGATGRAETDPCQILRGAIAAPQVKNHAALLEPAEIGGLMRSIREYSGDPLVRHALEFSAHVFQRPGEIRHAQWCDIDFQKAIWTIPAERMKMRQPHRVPLSKQALQILTEVQALTGREAFIFPSLRTSKRPMSENTVNAALRRMGYTSDEMTAHGFRAMASTQLNESGLFDHDAIERSLAHKDSNAIRGVYDRGLRWEERQRLHAWWSQRLFDLEAGREVKFAA
ncbi:tyrosine-type recombinase/integrase [Altererythrobacter sp. MF3-039]|uniref:tyrosine-type recombinase/integrase n=1 Tax=Altererythrobacter sp. MF3-039 TaxID=3252901 RepID=UPI00390CB237